MADVKEAKPLKKLEEELVFLVGFFIILGSILSQFNMFTLSSSYPTGFIQSTKSFFFNTFVPIIHILAYGLSALFILGIGWTIANLSALNKEIYAFYNPVVPVADPLNVTAPKKFALRWERVMSHLNSQNANDWKFAILEADIMLDDLLDILGYLGSTMSDKLKSVNPGDFKTLESAWEGHKIRNTIAHEGAEYVLGDREARRVIDLYRSVFTEFNVI